MQMHVVKTNECSKNETVKQLYKLGIKVGRFVSSSLTPPNLGSDTGLQSCETPVSKYGASQSQYVRHVSDGYIGEVAENNDNGDSPGYTHGHGSG